MKTGGGADHSAHLIKIQIYSRKENRITYATLH
jgi:hypothetical protein